MNSSSEHTPRTASAPIRRGDRGATGVEYALIGSLIAAACALTVGLLGADVLDLWQRVSW